MRKRTKRPPDTRHLRFWFSAPALRLTVFVLLGLVVLVGASDCLAVTDVTGNSRTYLRARETLSGDTRLPLYEYLDLSADKVGREDLSLHASGWARLDLGDESTVNHDSINGDLQYAYLRYRRATSNLVVHLGRTPVFEGLASEWVDGAYGRVDLRKNIGLAAFLGLPVETDHDGRDGDFIIGGRLDHVTEGKYLFGVTYLHESNDGSEFRSETGWDFWTRPWAPFSLQGRSSYSFHTSGWMEHDYSSELGPWKKARLFLNLQYISYVDFFTNNSNAAFDFSSAALDPDEKMLSIGGTVEYPALDNLPVFFDYRAHSYDIMGSANYFGGGCRWLRTDADGAGISLHRMDGDTDALSYLRFRVYGYKTFGEYDLSLDFIDVAFDQSLNGEDNTLIASVAGSRELWEKARVAADLDLASGLGVDSEVRVLVKFLYGFTRTFGAEGGE